MTTNGFSYRKLIIAFFVLLCLAAAGIYVLTRPWCVARIVKSVVNAQVKDFKLHELKFKKIGLDANGLVTVKDLRFMFTPAHREKQQWQGQIAALYLDNLRSLAKTKKINVSVEQADVASQEVRLKGVFSRMTIVLTGSKWNISSANLRGNSLAAPGVTLNSLKAYFSGNANLLIADPWFAQWAQGNLKGRLTLAPQDYTIHLDITQIELGEVASGMRGRINGDIDAEIKSADNEILTLSGSFDAPQGAQIPAAFLQPILSYIPASTQRDILEQLIAAGMDVLFDHANVRMKSVRSDSLNLLIKMDSKKLNLDLVVTVDLNVEGGLKSLLERLPQMASG